MRDLMRAHRITARSIPEVIEAMEQFIARLGSSRRVLFRGRKLSNEAFVNAAVIHVLGLPESEREAVLASAISRLETLLNDGDAAGPGAAEGGDRPIGGKHTTAEEVEPGAASRPKRKGSA